MSDLSRSKAQNATEDFKELDPTGPNNRAREAHRAYCAEPSDDNGTALLAALNELPKQTKQYLKQSMRC